MTLSRRDFLKAAVVAGVASKLGSLAFGEPATTQPASGDIAQRILGHTKQSVTLLGLGCGYIGHKPNTEADTAKVIEAALEGGIRYFDTSADYLESESRLGPALKSARKDIFLVTKINYPDAEACEKEFANSLKLLGTDHVDLLLLHCVGQRKETTEPMDKILAAGGAIEFLNKVKKDGRTRFIGMSIHAVTGKDGKPTAEPFAPAKKILDNADLDVVMPFVNYVSRNEINAEENIVAPCAKKGLGVVAMKVIGGAGAKAAAAPLSDDYDRAFRYTLSVPGVACGIIGCRTVDEVNRAIRAAKEFKPMSEAEMAETIKIGAQLLAAKSQKVAMIREHYPIDMGGVQIA